MRHAASVRSRLMVTLRLSLESSKVSAALPKLPPSATPSGGSAANTWLAGASSVRVSLRCCGATLEGSSTGKVRFTGAGVPPDDITYRRDTYRFEYPIAPAEVVALFRDYYGPTMNAFAAAEENERTADLERELVELFESQNESNDNATSIPATFLRVTVSL